MGWLIFWLIMGGVVAIIANSKGKNPVAWFLYVAQILGVPMEAVWAARRRGEPLAW